MKKIPLSGKKNSHLSLLVSDEDYEELSRYKWYLMANGSVVRYQYLRKEKTSRGWRSRYKLHQVHRHIMQPPKYMVVDHINHDRLDNRRDNLRVCTRLQNQQNMLKGKLNTSGYKGVRRNGSGWVAEIKDNKKYKYLGIFQDIREAARAYDKASKELHGEYGVTNGLLE